MSLHPDAWITATAAALRALLTDPDIRTEDLHRVAVDLAEDRRFNALPPALAAAEHVRESA